MINPLCLEDHRIIHSSESGVSSSTYELTRKILGLAIIMVTNHIRNSGLGVLQHQLFTWGLLGHRDKIWIKQGIQCDITIKNDRYVSYNQRCLWAFKQMGCCLVGGPY